MRRVAAALALLVAAWLPMQDAGAQGTDPLLRVSFDPPRVVVGQEMTLRIDVLAPNYMTGSPELPGFQVRNAVTRQLQTVNINDQKDGASFAGVRFTYAIYPQEPGSYAITGQKVQVKYAAEPPATREVEIALPPVSFEAFIPDAATELHPFLSASKLTVDQTIKRSSEKLKVGDAVTSIITIRAEGTPAMLLPPQQSAASDGLARYPAQPVLEEKTDSRTDVMTSTRVDSATYILERAGDYRLPAIDVRWWNPNQGKIEVAHLDAVTLKVAANPAVASSAGRSAARQNWSGVVDFVADRWLLGLIALATLVLLIWLAPRALRALAAIHRQRDQARRQSETFFFNRLRHAARRGDASMAYFAMLEWLQRFEPTAPLHSIDSFKVVARNPALNQEIDALERQLFGPSRGTADWSPSQLMRRIAAARQTLLRQSVQGEGRHALPQRINPVAEPVSARRQSRVPAR